MKTNMEFAVIGNCSVSALIDKDASVVWYCVPRLDGDPTFCGLLRNYPAVPDKQGLWAVGIEKHQSTEQSYLKNSAILITTFTDSDGNVLRITDFCPRFKHFERMYIPATLIRIIEPMIGNPLATMSICPMTNFGEKPCEKTRGSNHLRFIMPDQVLRLTTNLPLTYLHEERSFVITQPFAMVLGEDETLREGVLNFSRRMFNETRDYWFNWVRYLAIPFEWQSQVIRAAITLKLSAYEDTGAIIAAQTTSLPEAPGSARNWDYRFCWLRDSYFTVSALNHLGATQTMEQYLDYIINISLYLKAGYLQPVYGISGEDLLLENSIPHLAGFMGCSPVRTGNLAYEQVQHDVYGAVILSVSHLFFDQRTFRRADEKLFTALEEIGAAALRFFGKPDAGLWELRGSQHVHTYSQIMCWCAADRLGRIARHLQLEEKKAYWCSHAQHMRDEILRLAWSAERDALASAFGGNDMDASLLLIHELGFLKADDERFIRTVKAIEKDLLKGDFIFRYITADDFGEPEHAFAVCTFWYIDALAALGETDKARRLFENLLRHCNRHGLMAEHIDLKTGEMWGNFPQTYSMVGIIKSAMRISKSWEEAF
jgi:GH15 family glucan-1,4-alpha-glucosidase